MRIKKFDKLPVKQSVYFDIPDGRMMFAIPRGKITYVGTTDTNFNLDKDNVKTEIADAIYLISAVNNMFPSIELELDDIISSWAGLRPLIHEEGKSASELSRKDEIFTSDTGLVSIAGGKLTGYRKMAERVVNRVSTKMEEDYGIEFAGCTTDTIPLCGSDFKKFKHVKKYIEEVLYFDIDSIRTYMKPILADFKKAYDYDDAQLLSFKETLEEELDSHSNFSLERE